MSYSLEMSHTLLALLGDEQAVELFGMSHDLAAIMAFEVELAKAQEKCGRIPKGTGKRIEKTINTLEIPADLVIAGMARDGVAVPTIVSIIKGAVAPDDAQYVHFGATSQDAIDTSFMMRAAATISGVLENLQGVGSAIKKLHKQCGAKPLMGRTRMQQALPMTVGNRLDAWENNLATAAIQAAELGYPLQLSGPIGATLDEKVIHAMAKEMGLLPALRSWQNDRGPVLAIANACAGVTGAMGKIGADVALMAQNELAEIKLSGGGGSSAMPHKQNPVKAEVLVSLARFNAALLGGMHQAAVHEQERSGSAWTLEWLIMPQMVCAAAGSARLARELLESVESIGA
jgi:3-carboxy-cis,cis-muconate cycloisomerase